MEKNGKLFVETGKNTNVLGQLRIGRLLLTGVSTLRFHPFFNRRFSGEKSPTITVASFFSFFRQTTDIIVYVPLFSTRFTVNPAATGSCPCFRQKLSGRDWRVPSSNFFFGTVWLFFNFFVSKGSPLQFFDILQPSGFSKSPKGPSFYSSKNFALFEP